MTELDHRITDVTLAELRSSYPRTVGRNARLGSHGAGGPITIAVISTDNGRVGWGLVESGSAAPDELVGRSVAELIDPDRGVIDAAHRWADIALHDLAAVILDVPVWAMLGAAGDRQVEVYDGAIYFDDLDPETDPAGIGVILDNCRADAELGHRHFKIKIGRGNRWLPREAGDRRDIEVVRAVREAWPDARILVDANDGYDLDGFRAFTSAVADCGLYWVEEPFDDDLQNWQALREHLDQVSPGTLIADGESDPDPEQILTAAGDGAIDVALMDVMSFGLTRWRELMPRLVATGRQASPHAWGRPLKTLYAAQLAAGLGNVAIVEGVPGHTEGVDTAAHEFGDGVLTLGERPGFGLPLPRLG